jgi:starch synthase
MANLAHGQSRDLAARKAPYIWFPAVKAGSGADVFVERLVAGLHAAGVEAEITWFAHSYELAPFLLKLHRPPAGANIIHSNAACAFAFTGWGLPVVATEHHYVLDPDFDPYKTVLQRAYHRLWIGPWTHRSYRTSTALTAVSQFTANAVTRSHPSAAPAVIPHWLDYQLFSPMDAPVRQAGPFRLLFVGNFSRRKGGDVVEELARRLGDDFEIACTAGLRGGRSQAPTGIRVLGQLSRLELVEAYRSCDAVLVPSRYEGFGYAALEAMACSKPVVGFRSGAIAEVLDDAGSELLVEIDDIDRLEACCRLLAKDRALVEHAGAEGRRRAVGCYSQENAIAAYVDLYDSLLNPKAKQ